MWLPNTPQLKAEKLLDKCLITKAEGTVGLFLKLIKFLMIKLYQRTRRKTLETQETTNQTPFT